MRPEENRRRAEIGVLAGHRALGPVGGDDLGEIGRELDHAVAVAVVDIGLCVADAGVKRVSAVVTATPPQPQIPPRLFGPGTGSNEAGAVPGESTSYAKSRPSAGTPRRFGASQYEATGT